MYVQINYSGPYKGPRGFYGLLESEGDCRGIATGVAERPWLHQYFNKKGHVFFPTLYPILWS